MNPGRNHRQILFWCVLFGGLLGFLELASLLAIKAVNTRTVEPIERRARVLERQREGIDSLLAGQGRLLWVLDPELGWLYRPGFVGDRDRMTLQGLRGFRLYETEPGAALRVASFGDSFVYGTEVADGEVWSHVVEQTSPGVELLNYGVGGYGMDQAYLRYLREGAEFSPDFVLIGFTPVNLGRLVNVYRRFISTAEIPLVKPRFQALDGGGLSRLPVPLPDTSGFRQLQHDVTLLRGLGKNDWWYRSEVWANPLHDLSTTVRLVSGLWTRVDRRYFDPDRPVSGTDWLFRPESEAFRIQTALIDSVVVRIRDEGALPFILLLPDREVLEARISGGEASWDPLVEALRRSEVPLLDGTEAFLPGPPGPEGPAPWFAPGGHYSAEANRLLGEWLAEILLREATKACALGAVRPAVCG